MIPIENSLAGRVADIHHLMPDSNLHIVGRAFHAGSPSAAGAEGRDASRTSGRSRATSRARPVPQGIRRLGIRPIVAADTAGSAREIAELGDKSRAAIASRLAAEIYGLDILAEDIEDEAHNTTRFIVLSRERNGRSTARARPSPPSCSG